VKFAHQAYLKPGHHDNAWFFLLTTPEIVTTIREEVKRSFCTLSLLLFVTSMLK